MATGCVLCEPRWPCDVEELPAHPALPLHGMYLFLSDLHLGRGTPASSKAAERDAVACLRAHADATDGVYLLGDIFDAYIEYPRMVPKGGVRLLGLLAEWADEGRPVTCFAGNHDLWHLTYFEQDLGVRLVRDTLVEPLCGMLVHMAHGDGLTRDSRLYNVLKPIMQNRVITSLYRSLLPADGALRFARWFNRRFGSNTLNPDLVRHVEQIAKDLLVHTDADAVVLGHTHQHTLRIWPEGSYLNTGFWYEHRTFGRLDEDGLTLCRWSDGQAVPIGRHAAASAPASPRPSLPVSPE